VHEPPNQREHLSAARRLAALAESAVDAIVSADARGNITDWNPAAERLFGHRRADVLGQPLELLMPERFRARHRQGIARAASGSTGNHIGATAELSALRSDGTEFPIELSLSTFELDGRRYFTGVIRDISSRKDIERRVAAYATELEHKNAELLRKQDELLASQRELAQAIVEIEKTHRLLADFMSGHLLDGRYRLEHRVASNDAEAVYLATDVENDAPVYVGLVRCARAPKRSSDASLRAELSEIPHGPEILDAGVADVGLPYFVIEPLSGETLTDRLRRQRSYELADALRWCEDVADSLVVAHERGHVHARLSSDVLFFQDADSPRERLLVLEYEVAALTGGQPCVRRIPRAEDERFHAPELGLTAPDRATDCYALAALVALLADPARDRETPPESALLRAKLPPSLADMVLRGLSPEPSERPSAVALRDSLRTARAKAGAAL